MTLLSRFLHDETGGTAIEYSLIGGLIALAIILGATVIGTQLNTKFSSVGSALTTP